MIDSRPLSELKKLDPAHLYLFVVGPGVGESVVAALPRHGWVAVDSCRSGRSVAALSIHREWRRSDADIIEAVVLTHPHADHAHGFAELLEQADPPTVAVAGSPPPGTHLVEALEALWAAVDVRDTSATLRAGAVKTAISAIRSWEEDHEGALVLLSDGVRLPGTNSPCAVVAHAPDAALANAFIRNMRDDKQLIRKANALSTVLSLEYGGTRVVLGGDLPRFETGTKTPVSTGWDHVMNVHPVLNQHAGLKVPHHGSIEALHPDLLKPRGGGDRAWAVTPFDSAQLPRESRDGGLTRLLKNEACVHATRAPSYLDVTLPLVHPAKFRAGELKNRMKGQPTKIPFLDSGEDLKPRTAPGVLDAVWCFAFDDSDHVVARWRGEHALEFSPAFGPKLPNRRKGSRKRAVRRRATKR